ncbi:MAG: hypothetical protein PUB91_00290 [Bacteroidales bacterium]|nr:hypothetical protein [Bacteroidales bacterium]
MILAADSGSTKTDWALLSAGKEPVFFKSAGLNPNFADMATAPGEILSALPAGICPEDVSGICFYGAGVNSVTAGKMERMLRETFPSAGAISVESDMLGAARALLGNEKGFVAILGTGSNSCLYDGEGICRNVPSLGFVLGDEGSGGAIGRMLLRDCLRGTMPEAFGSGFRDMLGMDAAGVIDRIYTRPRPNAFCASLARYALDRKDTDPYAAALVGGALRSFFSSVVSLYDGLDGLAFNAVGTVSRLCEKELMSLATEWGMKPGKVLGSPIEGLAAFHRPI